MNYSLRVTKSPGQIIASTDVKQGAPDELVQGALSAAERMIAAPDGWLGRSLGEKTLEWRSSDWPSRLPAPPVMDVVSIQYETKEGGTATVDPNSYQLVDDTVALRVGSSWPIHSGSPGSVVVTYRAGYEQLPPEAKMALILAARSLVELADDEGNLRSEQVEGSFSRSYNSPEIVERTRTKAVQSLLSGLRLYRE